MVIDLRWHLQCNAKDLLLLLNELKTRFGGKPNKLSFFFNAVVNLHRSETTTTPLTQGGG
jgi:hypothetical protein